MRPFAFRRKPVKDVRALEAPPPGGLILSEGALAHGVEEKRRQAVAAGGDVLAAIAAELARGERRQLPHYWKQLVPLFDVVQLADEYLRLLARTEGEPTAVLAEPAVPEYLVSSWFLADCHVYLLSDPDDREVLHFVSGIKIREGQRTLDRMLRVGLSQQSTTHAVANQQDVQRALIECSERWGHAAHGLFHRHPGRGPLATRPSSTDLTTHERYERAYPLVGAIFECTGFVRFFGHRPFTIRLYGKGVIQHEENLFQITDLPRHLSQPDAWAGHAGRGERDRPAGEGEGVYSAGARDS